MRRVIRFRGACAWLVVAMLLVAAGSAEAGRVREVIKQVIPRVSQQLSKIAVNGKVAISAACVASACVINFAQPAEAADYLSSDSELVKSRGASAIFAKDVATIEKSQESSGLSFSHWAAKGVYHESGDNLGTLRIGTSAEINSFSAYVTVAYRWHPDTSEGIDSLATKTRSYIGANTLLFDNGEGTMSYGYVNTDMFVAATRTIVRNARGYLLRYHQGPIQIAGFGYEYIDNDVSSLTTPGESADAVRSHGVALYRAGLKYPISDLLMVNDALTINLKLNSAMHLGDIGPVKLGETWQGELNDWASEDANLDHLLYHSAGGSINFSLANDRINFSFGGAIQHSINGDIQRAGMADGDFDIRNTTLTIGGTIDLLPDHGISLEAFYDRYDQHAEANLDGQHYDYDSSGTWARIAAKKKF